MMTKKYIIRVSGRNLYVDDVEYTTPIPTSPKECVPPNCVVSSVKFSSTAKTFIDLSLASALVIGIRNIMPINLVVVETWKD